MNRSSRRTRLAAAAVLAPLALALVACGGDDKDGDDATTPAASTSTSPSPTDDDASEAPTETPTDNGTASTDAGAPTGDVETAAQTALGEIDGTVFSVDLDDQGWDVSIVAADGQENDVDLAADATTVTRGPVVDPSDDNDDAAERERLLGASVDYLAAIETASGEVQGTVTGVDLSEDNGVAIWEVTFDEDTTTEQTVEIDAQSGDVLRVETDD